jgi:hypothetical protein
VPHSIHRWLTATPEEGGDASADVAGKAQRVTGEHVMAATNDPWL